MTPEARSEAELDIAISDLAKQYDVCMTLVGERLRKCIGGKDE